VGFEPTTPVFERAKIAIHALDPAATTIGNVSNAVVEAKMFFMM
jgi:hypothetical protein